jgi:serine protease Do
VKKKVFIGIALLLLGFVLGGVSFQFLNKQSPLPAPQVYTPKISSRIVQTSRAFSDIVNAVSPAVVNISTIKVLRRDTGFSDDPFFDFFNEFFSPFYDFGPQRKWKEQSLGSGVIVSPDGYIITNNHVVSNAERIKVTLYDKRVFKGKVIGADPKTDIAVVKISSEDLPTIPWGDSDELQVGEFVLAIGNPFGLSHTVTMGIISAVGRANVGIADYEDFIQTDAAINPGNSGGPLVDTEGNLIGINTAIFSKSGGYQGIGFAVPSNMARRIMEQLIEEGRVIRGWLGVSIQELTPELSKKFGHKTLKGALVGETLKGSPAEKSGIRRGDIILQYGGKEVTSPAALKNMVAQSKPGTKVPITILRNKKQLRLITTVGELPVEMDKPVAEPAFETEQSAFSGLSVITLTEDIARQLGLDRNETGVVVIGVQAGSPAEEAGIKRGDVIQEIDRKRIMTLDDFMRIASEIKPDETVLMFINRGGKKFYLTVLAS